MIAKERNNIVKYIILIIFICGFYFSFEVVSWCDDTIYFPCEVGNKWTYRAIPIIKLLPIEDSMEFTITILSKEKIRNYLEIKAIHDLYLKGSFAMSTDILYRVDDKSVTKFTKSFLSENIIQETILTFPIKLKNKWKSIIKEEGGFKYEIIGINEKIKTLAGSFEQCVAIKKTIFIENKWESTIDYYAPNVGYVKTIVIIEGKKVPMMELKEYHIKKN